MKKDYILILFLLIMASSYSQDKPTVVSQTTTIHKSEEIKGFELFPNPVSNGIIRIKTLKNAERTVDIYDVLGKLVFFTTTKKPRINVSSLKSGIYIIKVYEQGSSATRKLIIK